MSTPNRHKPIRFLYVFEFAKSDLASSDPLGGALFEEIKRQCAANVEVRTASGLFCRYTPDGTHFQRLINFFYMHLLAPVWILLSRADIVVVRTTPPMIQMTYAFWCRLFGRKQILWLMDYHPVFGARTAPEGSLSKKIWGLLAYLDKKLLKCNALIVCLDQAMRTLINQRAPGTPTLVYPTWNLQEVSLLDLAKSADYGAQNPLRLLYSGNLGAAHPLGLLKSLLKALAKKIPVQLCYCGNDENAGRAFGGLCKETGANLECLPRVKDYAQMGAFYKEHGFDYGIVLLGDSYKGLVSPSKFSGYSSFGLPVLYLGPEGTNAWLACAHCGAGIAITNAADIEPAVEKLIDVRTQCACAQKCAQARAPFGPLVPKRLARALLENLKLPLK